jgi:hypothetical protein
MRSALVDLKNTLAEQMTGSPYDPDSTLPETDTIRRLVEQVEDYSLGDISLADLNQVFQGTGYDILSWISLKVDEGILTGDDDAS